VNGADKKLLDVYGTEAFVKEGELPAPLAIAAALIGIRLMFAYKARQEELRANAERMNEVARLLEAKQMEASLDAFRKHGSVIPASKYGYLLPLEKKAFGVPFLGTGLKVLGAGAMGYGAYKGVKGAYNFMNQPPPSYGKRNDLRTGGSPMQHNIGEWGHPE